VFAPTRLFYAVRPRAALCLLAAAALVAALFAATPFLIPAVADRYGIGLGKSGLISAAQVGGFAVAAFAAGRLLTPKRWIHVAAALVAALFNGLSAINDSFELLLVLRSGAGIATGFMVWLAWSDAMGDQRVMRDVAAIGPLTVLLASPVVAWVAAEHGDRPVYAGLAVASLVVAAVPVPSAAGRVERRRMSPSRSNVVLLVALGLLTASGSALFVYAASIGSVERGLSSLTVSLAYSANAAAGFIGARIPVEGRRMWPWIPMLAACAGVVGFVPNALAFFAGVAVWGFAFWMTVPVILTAIAGWSLVPGERVGDAQSVMAVGRAMGPAMGAAVLSATTTFSPLTAVSVGGLVIAAFVVAGVSHYRRGRLPPWSRGAPSEVVAGMTRAQVSLLLGPPVSVALNYLPDPDVRATGPRPMRIAPGRPVEVWRYPGRGAEARILYFTSDGDGPVDRERFGRSDPSAWVREPTLHEDVVESSGEVV